MKVLITGGSGFLGSHIIEFANSKTKITRIGRNSEDDIFWDISEPPPALSGHYQQIIHCAGKAHSLPKSEKESQEFFNVNYKGTIQLTEALSKYPPKQLVFISSIAVYGKEKGTSINENLELLGNSPYALSKIKAEQYVQSWGKSNNVKILILRLPLIAGKNPPGNLGKMIKGLKINRYVSFASGKAKKSIVLAEDVASFILDNPEASGTFNLTDGYHPNFYSLESLICKQLGRKRPLSIPLKVAKILGSIGDTVPFFPLNSALVDKMTNDLTFDDSKARTVLNWQPKCVTDHFIIE